MSKGSVRPDRDDARLVAAIHHYSSQLRNRSRCRSCRDSQKSGSQQLL